MATIWLSYPQTGVQVTALEKQKHELLCEIGRELDDTDSCGTLDFEAFRLLLTRAISTVGADHPGLEMFCGYARGEGWFSWMTQEIRKAPSARVA